MNILALDCSSKSTGYCVAIDGEIKDYGCITSSSKDVTKRLFIMRDGIKELIEKYDIEHIIAEDVQGDYGNNRAKTVLTQLQGILLLTAYDINPKIQVELLQASAWRSRIGIHTGRGIKREELKQADIAFVKERYGIDAENDDVADSIAIYAAYEANSKSAF